MGLADWCHLLQGGKSCYLRMVALIAIMAQVQSAIQTPASSVPASTFMHCAQLVLPLQWFVYALLPACPLASGGCLVCRSAAWYLPSRPPCMCWTLFSRAWAPQTTWPWDAPPFWRWGTAAPSCSALLQAPYRLQQWLSLSVEGPVPCSGFCSAPEGNALTL